MTIKTHTSWPAGVALALAFLTVPLIAAKKPVEGKLEAFGGNAKFETQRVFGGGRQPNVVVAMDGTVLTTFNTGGALQVRRSEDGGKTWGNPITLDKYKHMFSGGGVTVDETSGDIFMFAEKYEWPKTPPPPTIYRSKDHGKTWKVQETVIHPAKNGDRPTMHMAEHGITLRHGKCKGRLLRPARFYGPADSRKYLLAMYNTSIYSDDGGKTWRTSDRFPELGTGEGTVAELSDGRIYYNSRRHGDPPGAKYNPCLRWEAWSNDGGATWKNSAVCKILPDGARKSIGAGSGCMAGLVRLPVKGRDIVLYSNCDSQGSDRKNVSVWASFDGAKTWPIKRRIFDGPSAYSSLSAGRPGTPSEGWIYSLLEGGKKHRYAGGHVARFNLSWLLEGAKTGDGTVPDWGAGRQKMDKKKHEKTAQRGGPGKSDTPRFTTNELILNARRLREMLWKDPHRPRFHLMPPEGFFNDANGALFWKGRYHLFYLARTPITGLDKRGGGKWVAVWDHVSSRDLVHWIYHPPAVRPKIDGSTPRGIYSGGAIKNAPKPTLIYHVPGQGTCISVAQDDKLIRWKELPQNPVIRPHKKGDEFVVFDPAGWYEKGKYYALIGNKNKRRGFEGDCTSLFTSTNLVDWKYQGPFYKSDRKWTDRREDAACPDFYRMGNSDTWMLLMHCHGPYRNTTHYYLGKWTNERFVPERHGRMSWLGHQLSAPECLVDGKGRNIFFGWMAESRSGGESLWGYENKIVPGKTDRHAWASVVSLPRIMSLTDKGTLGIAPAPEFEKLRYNPREKKNVSIPADREVTLEKIAGDVMELAVEINPGPAAEIGVKVRCAPDGSEETLVVYNPKEKRLKIDFRKSTLAKNVFYSGLPVWKNLRGKKPVTQEAPFELADGETLKLRIFIDKSVLEVFANGRQCITQRIYPSGKDSKQVKLFARGAGAKALVVKAWDMEQVMPW